MRKAKLIFWLGLVLGASLRLVVQPVRAAFTIDGSWGAPCPECLEDESCDGITGANDEGKWCITAPDSECQAAGVDRPDEVCRTSGPDAWIYTFVVRCQKCTNPKEEGCGYRYEYETKNCSASDRCEGGPNRTNACQEVSDAEMFSVSNSSGHILAGQCSASECSEEGCKNGGWYKTCCKYNDVDGSGGPSVGDTLTGEPSSCSNCFSTDCCTHNGGACVYGTGCPYGMVLTELVPYADLGCWKIGSTTYTEPTPTSTDGGGRSGEWVIEPCGDCCLRKAWCDGDPGFNPFIDPEGNPHCGSRTGPGCPYICGEASHWNGTEWRCVAWCKSCPNKSPSSPANITPCSQTLNFGDDILFSWRPPSEDRCGDTWGIVCASGNEGIPCEDPGWGCHYVLLLKYPSGREPESCSRPHTCCKEDGTCDSSKEGCADFCGSSEAGLCQYCEIARQERGLDAGGEPVYGAWNTSFAHGSWQQVTCPSHPLSHQVCGGSGGNKCWCANFNGWSEGPAAEISRDGIDKDEEHRELIITTTSSGDSYTYKGCGTGGGDTCPGSNKDAPYICQESDNFSCRDAYPKPAPYGEGWNCSQSRVHRDVVCRPTPDINDFNVYTDYVVVRGSTLIGRQYTLSLQAKVRTGTATAIATLETDTGERHSFNLALTNSYQTFTFPNITFNSGSRLRLIIRGADTREATYIKGNSISLSSDYIEPRTQYLLTDDLPGGTYEWRVKALVEVPTGYSMWSYSDPCSFTITTPTGRVRGNVYESCDCSGTTSPDDRTWVVTCSGDGIDGVIDGSESSQVAHQDSNSSFTCLTTGGSDQLPYGDYTISFSPSSGRTGSSGCSSPQTVTLDSASVTATPFYQCLPPVSSWFQVVGGDLTSQSSVSDQIPLLCRETYNAGGDCLPFIATDRLTQSSSPLFAENGIVVAKGTISCGSNCLGVGDPNNWRVEDNSFSCRPGEGGFQYYRRLLGQEHEVLSGNQSLSAIDGLSDGSVSSGEIEIKLIDGDLTVDRNLAVAQGGMAMLITSGNIVIEGNVTQLAGIFLADGNIVINDGPNKDAGDQVTLDGVYAADANCDGAGSVNYSRDLGLDNNFNPAVVFRYRPDFLITMLKENVAVESIIDWEEVKP